MSRESRLNAVSPENLDARVADVQKTPTRRAESRKPGRAARPGETPFVAALAVRLRARTNVSRPRAGPFPTAAFPEHRAKASLLRANLDVRPLDATQIVGAPARLRELVEHPPLDASWITEVEYCAAALLVADVHRLDTAAFERFWYDVMSDLVRSRLYSVLLAS
jgi:hypothetical protein